jgi:flagellar biosynthesis anti-sigma factor FlgM
MVIEPGGPIQGPGPVDRKRTKGPAPQKLGQSEPKSDKVELSTHSKLVSKLSSVPNIRQDRVNQLKQEIESGKFDNDERLRGAVQKFLEENRDII